MSSFNPPFIFLLFKICTLMAYHLYPILCIWDVVTTYTPVTVFFPLWVWLCSNPPPPQKAQKKWIWIIKSNESTVYCAVMDEVTIAIQKRWSFPTNPYCLLHSHAVWEEEWSRVFCCLPCEGRGGRLGPLWAVTEDLSFRIAWRVWDAFVHACYLQHHVALKVIYWHL